MEPDSRDDREIDIIKEVEEIDKLCTNSAALANKIVTDIGPRLREKYGRLGDECVDQMEDAVKKLKKKTQKYSERYRAVIQSDDKITNAFLEIAYRYMKECCSLLNFSFELNETDYTLFTLCKDGEPGYVSTVISAFEDSAKTLDTIRETRVANFLEEVVPMSNTTSESDVSSKAERRVNEEFVRALKTKGPWLGSFSRTKPAGVWFASETTPRLVSAAERQSGPEIARGAVAVSGLVSVICSPEDAAKFKTRGELVFVNPGRNVPFDTTTPAQYASADDVATPLVAQQSHQELVVMGAGMAGPGTVADPGWSPKDPAPWGIPEGAPVVFAPVPLEPAGDGMLPPMAVRGAYHPGNSVGSGATPFAVLGLESAASSQLSDAMLRRVTLGTYCGKNERGSGILVDLGVCVV